MTSRPITKTESPLATIQPLSTNQPPPCIRATRTLGSTTARFHPPFGVATDTKMGGTSKTWLALVPKTFSARQSTHLT